MFWLCKVLALQRFARDRPHQDPHSRQMPQDLRLSGSDVLVLSVDNWKVGFAGCGSFPIKNKFGDVLVQEPSFSVKRVDDGTGFVQKRAKKKSVQGVKRKRGKTPKKTKMFLWGGD